MRSQESAQRLGATVLLGKGLSPGKLRGLQRISNPDGTLTMLALDQNSSVIEMAARALKAKGEDRDPTYDEIVDAKLDLMRQMAPAASGVLIDAYYGAWSAIASEAIPPRTGLLVRYERSGSPKNRAGAPLAAVEPGWSVEKIKRMGADAVKLLAQFEPTEPDSAEHQFQLVEDVYAECTKHDILLLLETVSFPFGGETKSDASYLDRKPATVIEAARQLSRFCDIYKSEFPGTLGRESDSQLEDNLHALDAASERPWVLLSAGVDYADYVRQVEMALAVGASGILGGRAFWKEYFLQESPERRTEFAATTARQRLADVDALVRERGTPWFARYGFAKEELSTIRAAEGWHARYGTHRPESAGVEPVRAAPGEVY
jgi:tagatose 1,6-diphosphate aldolase